MDKTLFDVHYDRTPEVEKSSKKEATRRKVARSFAKYISTLEDALDKSAETSEEAMANLANGEDMMDAISIMEEESFTIDEIKKRIERMQQIKKDYLG